MAHNMIAPNSSVLLNVIRTRIDADFVGTPGYSGLAFITYREWMHPQAVDEVNAEDAVCVSGGHSFVVSLTGGLSQALCHVADALSDDTMDQLHGPWPEIVLPSGATVVLDLAVDDTDQAVWQSRDGAVRCPVGYLRSTFGRVGGLR